MRGRGPGYAAWELALELSNVERGRLGTGDGFTLDGVRFSVLWPDAGSVPAEPGDEGTSINNVSVVLLAEFGRQRALLMGDVEEGIDPILLSRGLPRADVLKVAHHGSRTSSTEPFLATVHPAIAVISAGEGNPYGHPTPATLARLASVGARIAPNGRQRDSRGHARWSSAALRLQRPSPPGATAGGRALQLVAAGLGCPTPQPAPPPAPGREEPTGYDRSDVHPRPTQTHLHRRASRRRATRRRSGSAGS